MPEHDSTFDYNGWKGNGESRVSARLTWLVALWLSNEPFTDAEIHRIACEHPEDGKTGDALREFTEEFVIGAVLIQAGLATDILNAVLRDEVNWAEIAVSLRDGNCDDDNQNVE